MKSASKPVGAVSMSASDALSLKSASVNLKLRDVNSLAEVRVSASRDLRVWELADLRVSFAAGGGLALLANFRGPRLLGLAEPDKRNSSYLCWSNSTSRDSTSLPSNLKSA